LLSNRIPRQTGRPLRSWVNFHWNFRESGWATVSLHRAGYLGAAPIKAETRRREMRSTESSKW
jgi:hypothetical protein